MFAFSILLTAAESPSMSGSKDVERHAGQNSEQKALGFAALSSLMASDDDQELLIFRKFDELSARNLLYLQCELLSIEERLKRYDRKVSSSGDMDLEEAAETWEVMVEQTKDGRIEAQEIMRLVKELRVKMKEYRKWPRSFVVYRIHLELDEALDLQSRIARLHTPDKRVFRVAQNELWGGGPLDSDGRKRDPIVGGKTKDYLDTENDLVSLKAPVETDTLSRMLRAIWPGKVSKYRFVNDRSGTLS